MEGVRMMALPKTQPHEFLAAFREAVEARAPELKANWFADYRQYTQIMRTEIFPTIAKTLKLEDYSGDYYTLDAIFYREKDETNFRAPLTYAKHIEVAIEHENELRGSEKEMNKLQLFNAPLKVLITYGSDADQQVYLKKYAEIIGWADVFEDISTLRRQLVIFGTKVGDEVRWAAYLYEKAGFATI